MTAASERVYTNTGNTAVLALLDRSARTVLDVGCGSGDLAALLSARDSEKRIYGITASPQEAANAARYMQACWVADLESELPGELAERKYDLIVFSHVLEHLPEPQRVLKRFVQHLQPGGAVVIAVPNVMFWRQRWQFMRGRFEYQNHGIMDETHLRFFSYETAARFLLAETPELRLIERTVSGSVPLWTLRRHIISERVAARIDAFGCRHWPNLFGGEILLRCTKAAV
jgi:2-polyprenyl-3-methyl-5-hydroxy-6-metoxy-1,4-benzoquinol methylase